MTRTRRIASATALSLTALALGASGASAAKVTQSDSGKTITLDRGESLRIQLTESDSGSTGYHWDEARKPSRSILTLISSRPTEAGQVFKYKSKRAGKTSLVLKYVPPGRGAKAVETFRLTVRVR